MSMLLDTHAFIWFIEGNPKMPQLVRESIENEPDQVYLSIASLWEMAIKSSLRKLSLNQAFDSLIPDQIAQNNFTLLPISLQNVIMVEQLPFHHRDPFDRMLVAQSLTESLPFISADLVFESYGVDRIWH